MELVKNELSNSLFSRISITYIFMLFGVFSANLVVRTPDFQTIYGLSNANLGLVLAGIPVGGFIALLFVGKLISRFGSRMMTMVGVMLLHISYPIVFLIPSVSLVFLFLISIGAESTIMNISMNAQGLTVENDMKTSIISSLHAFFAVGMVVGAVLGSFLISLKMGPEEHLLVVSLLFLPLSIFSFVFLRKDDEKETNDQKIKHSFFDTFKTKEIWIIGAVCFIAAFGEWTMRHWGTIYVTNLATKDIAALAFADFSLFMTLGRLIGDIFANRYPTKNVIRSFSVIAFVGIMISALATNVIMIFVGFAIWGFGLSIIIPFSFKTAGNNKAVELGSGIAGVAIFANVASIIEPALVGLIAEFTSLSFSFALVAFLLVMVVFIGMKLPSEAPNRAKLTVE